MDKKIAGLVAAIGALAPLGAAQAAAGPGDVEQAMRVQSFSELLQPIPNAAALLKVVDESQAAPSQGAQLAQLYHHHHHHHHHYYRRWRRHHHHHHHHHYD